MPSFRHIMLSLLAAACILLGGMTALAQQPTAPAPTLVPPTRVPTQPAQAEQPADYSGVATLVEENTLRLGTRYNERPFSYLDENGQLTGYEVELMESLGVQLGVAIDWVQVTAET
ncbi:MAG: transporter substrate-binding domain-containing protein, partial [Anaerolineales bacterium]